MAAAKSMSPCAAVNPASGRITSLGRGGNRFSSAIASPAPGAPSLSIRSVAQPATPPAISPAETAYVISIMPATLGTAPPPSPWRTPPTRPAAHHTPAMRENTPARRGRVCGNPRRTRVFGPTLRSPLPLPCAVPRDKTGRSRPVGDDLTEKAPPGIDPSTPTSARVYDYFLGGKDNFAADREVADMVMQLVPEAPVVARGNRAAIERAVTYMASDVGIDQFIDIGSGLPTASNVHQFARDANPAARAVYIDNDPIVLAHGRALLTERGVAIIHHVPDDRDPAGVVAALLPHLAPGSHVMLTHLHDSGDDPRVEEAKRVLQSGLGGSYFRHSSEIERFMDGLTILEPGVAHVTEWRPNGPTGPLEHPLHTQMVAVMGRKD